MKYFLLFGIVAGASFFIPDVHAQKVKKPSTEIYYPEADSKWIKKSPAEAGLNAQQVEEAIAFAKAHESKSPRHGAIALPDVWQRALWIWNRPLQGKR